MKMKIVTKSGRVPEYKTSGAAGFDIQAHLEAPVVLHSGEHMLVPTGLYFQVPAGYEAQVRARSGLAARHGIGLVNGIGTIDSDYRGEIRVPLINWGKEDFLLEDGIRIAQVVINKVEQVDVEAVDELETTERGAGGFGHTGL